METKGKSFILLKMESLEILIETLCKRYAACFLWVITVPTEVIATISDGCTGPNAIGGGVPPQHAKVVLGMKPRSRVFLCRLSQNDL